MFSCETVNCKYGSKLTFKWVLAAIQVKFSNISTNFKCESDLQDLIDDHEGYMGLTSMQFSSFIAPLGGILVKFSHRLICFGYRSNSLPRVRFDTFFYVKCIFEFGGN